MPACAERGPQILNICQLYEQGPVVLALFVDAGSCTRSSARCRRSCRSSRACASRRSRSGANAHQLRRLIAHAALTLPVGIDNDGAVAALYKVLSCPQVNFAYRGGVVQSRALLSKPSLASLRARVSGLVAASRAHGGREPAA